MTDPISRSNINSIDHSENLQETSAPAAVSSNQFQPISASTPETNSCAPHPASCVNSPSADSHAPSDLSCMIGSTGYYRARADDFMKRHPGEKPPGYYLEYGEKYAHRFTEQTAKELTPTGQEWLKNTFMKLQQAIEDLRQKDPAAFDRLEQDGDAFKAFAYGSHAASYLDAGLSQLSIGELKSVGLTPDASDLANLDGVKQVAQVAVPLASQKAEQFEKALNSDLEEAMQKARLVFAQ